MAIAVTVLDSGGTAFGGTGITSQATASVSPSANALVLLCLEISRDAVTGLAVTGNGLTWVQVATPYTESGYVTAAIFRAMGASPSTGAVSASWNEGSFDVNYELLQVTGVDTSGTNGSGAVVQSVTGGGFAITSLTLSYTIATGNGGVAVFGQRGATFGSTPRSGWTELSDAGISSGGALETQWRADPDTAAGASFAGAANIAAIAVEVKAAGAAATNLPYLQALGEA